MSSWAADKLSVNFFSGMCLRSMVKKDLKVVVLAGGIGSEREVSLSSGTNVTEALKKAGVNVRMWDITPDD